VTVPPLTVSALLHAATLQLAANGVDHARLTTRLLLHHATGISPQRQITERDTPIGIEQVAHFTQAVRRRAAREPLAYITGRREFWSLDLKVTPDVLIPRPDSETVVEAALSQVPPNPGRVLDLGVGSGCLLFALLSEWRAAYGVGIDRSMAALRVAAQNAHQLALSDRCAFVASDWATAVHGVFDVVVCNPPYIAGAAIDELESEIAHEPRLALDGGADGLGCYRQVIGQLPRLLPRHGLAVLEIGAGQHTTAANLMRRAGLVAIREHHDLSGTVRCLSGRRKT